MPDLFTGEQQIQQAIHQTAAALAELQELGHYYTRARQVGHTTAMIRGATDGAAVILAADASHRDRFRRAGLSAESRSSLQQLRGMQSPLLVDHWALQGMISDAHQRLEQITRELVGPYIREQGPQ